MATSYMQKRKETRDAIVAAGFTPPPLQEKASDYHYLMAQHHGIFVEECEFCVERENNHKAGKHGGGGFRQGCPSCRTEFPNKEIPKWVKLLKGSL
jgi:hypothetical protein